MMSNDRHRVYKSLETDAEFAARVRLKHDWWRGDNYRSGEGLDDYAWAAVSMQRRVIERSTETYSQPVSPASSHATPRNRR